jgi:predicted alpha/beta superfamily hydrolase
VPIIVGLDNGGESRIAEYSPFPHPDYGGGQAETHAYFLTQTLMPWVEDRFAVSQQAALTGIGGSSLGGLFAAYAAQQYPGRFGFVLAFSPAFWFNPAILESFSDGYPALGTRWWMAMGSGESTDKTPLDVTVGTLPMDKHAQNLLEAGNRLRRAGHTAASLHLQIDPEGEHNEAYWRMLFPQAIDWWLTEAP